MAGARVRSVGASGDAQLRFVLLWGGAGAVVVLLGFFGLAGGVAGLASMASATLLSRRAARPTGDLNWWRLLAAGTGLVALGIAIGLGVEALGGLLAAVGAGLGVIAVALALP